MKDVLDLATGWELPASAVIVLGLILAAKPVGEGLEVLVGAAGRVAQIVIPAFYRSATKDEVERRQRLARFLLQDLDLVESDLHWLSGDFVNLSAMTQSVDPERHATRRRRFWRAGFAGYRVLPLHKALVRQVDRLILLQGRPGSGKSVALRYLARTTLEKAAKARHLDATLAILVSLRDLEVSVEDVTADVLLEYVRRQANRRGAQELGQYLEERLVDDILQGRVILLLDSFDEIPAMLGEASLDRTARPFVEAIQAAMGAGRSLCVVAAREYRGPKVQSWSRIQLLALSRAEQLTVLERTGLARDQIDHLLPVINDERLAAELDYRNPLYLALLGRYFVRHGDAPRRSYELFEDYVADALEVAAGDQGGADWIAQIHVSLSAFAMRLTEGQATGLAAPRSDLVACLEAELPNDSGALQRGLDTLMRSRLLVEVRGSPGGEGRVAFAHRRVQEYFVTTKLVGGASQVALPTVAREGRWRETAVALLHIGQPDDQVALHRELAEMLRNGKTDPADEARSLEIVTPEASHALDMLAAAYGNDPRGIPVDLRQVGGDLLVEMWRRGGIGQRKLALDSLAVAPVDAQGEMVDQAFGGTSHWLRSAALRECARFQPLPPPLGASIRRLLIFMLHDGLLYQARRSIDADLRRLNDAKEFLWARRQLALIPAYLAFLCVASMAIQLSSNWPPAPGDVRRETIWLVLFPATLLWGFLGSAPVSHRSHSRLRAAIETIAGLFGWGDIGLFDSQLYALAIGITGVLTVLINGAFIVALVATGNYDSLPILLATLVLHLHALVWPALFVASIRFGWVSRRTGFGSLVMLVPLNITRTVRRYRGYLRLAIKAAAIGVLYQALVLAALIGLFWLLDHAGYVGRVSKIALSIFFASFIPLAIVFMSLRAVRTRRRIRRLSASQDALTTEGFVRLLCGRALSSDAALFVRQVRLRRDEAMLDIDAATVQQLILLLEAPGLVDQALGHPSTTAAVRNALREGLIDARRLRLWDADLLDELGQMFEAQRARV